MSNSINQGAVDDIVIKPVWGTFDSKEDNDSKEERFIAIVESLQKLLNNKADIIHNHDDRYYTETEISSMLHGIDESINSKSDKDHTHDDRYYTETEVDNTFVPLIDLARLFSSYGLVRYNNMLYIDPDT